MAKPVADQIASFGAFLSAQRAAGQVGVVSTMGANMANSIMMQINEINDLTSNSATELTVAISGSCFEEHDKTRMTSAVATRLNTHMASEHNKKNRRSPCCILATT